MCIFCFFLIYSFLQLVVFTTFFHCLARAARFASLCASIFDFVLSGISMVWGCAPYGGGAPHHAREACSLRSVRRGYRPTRLRLRGLGMALPQPGGIATYARASTSGETEGMRWPVFVPIRASRDALLLFLQRPFQWLGSGRHLCVAPLLLGPPRAGPHQAWPRSPRGHHEHLRVAVPKMGFSANWSSARCSSVSHRFSWSSLARLWSKRHFFWLGW